MREIMKVSNSDISNIISVEYMIDDALASIPPYSTESLLLSQNDVVYNLDKFESSDNGKLIVTGYTGSGKSTLSKELAKKYKCELIMLDDEMHRIDRKKINDVYENGGTNEEASEVLKQLVREIVDEFLNDDRKLIIEGIYIFKNYEPEEIRKHSIIIKGTSAFISGIRAVIRNSNDPSCRRKDDDSILSIMMDVYRNLFIKECESFIKTVKSWITKNK